MTFIPDNDREERAVAEKKERERVERGEGQRKEKGQGTGNQNPDTVRDQFSGPRRGVL